MLQTFVLVSCHLIRKSASQRDINLVWSVVDPLSDSGWHITCLEQLLSSRVVVTCLKEIFLRVAAATNLSVPSGATEMLGPPLGLTVTEINIKKYRKKKIKTLKCRKICMDGVPKSMQQGRDDSTNAKVYI